MVEEYEEIADSQYPSERLEYLDEDYGELMTACLTSFFNKVYKLPRLSQYICCKSLDQQSSIKCQPTRSLNIYNWS